MKTTNNSIKLQSDVYSLQAIKRTAYDLQGTVNINIDKEANYYIINFLHNDHLSNSIIEQFHNILLHNQIQVDLEKQYHTIRELIIFQAISPANVKSIQSIIENMNEQ